MNDYLKKLIENETDRVEHKAFWRWNPYRNRLEKENINKIIEVIAAFLNSKGGILIIGIDDKTKEVIGIKGDLEFYRRNTPNKSLSKAKDDLYSHMYDCFHNLLKNSISNDITIEIKEYENEEIILICIKPSKVPVFMGETKQFIYKVGDMTKKINIDNVGDLYPYFVDAFNYKGPRDYFPLYINILIGRSLINLIKYLVKSNKKKYHTLLGVTLIFLGVGFVSIFFGKTLLPFLGGYRPIVFSPVSAISVSLIMLIILRDIKKRKSRGELRFIYPNENYLLLGSLFWLFIGFSMYISLFGLELSNLLIGFVLYFGSLLFVYILERIQDIRRLSQNQSVAKERIDL